MRFGKAYCRARAEIIARGCSSVHRKRSGGFGHEESRGSGLGKLSPRWGLQGSAGLLGSRERGGSFGVWCSRALGSGADSLLEAIYGARLSYGQCTSCRGEEGGPSCKYQITMRPVRCVFEFSGDLVMSFGKAYCKAKAEMVVKGCCSAIRKRSGGSGHGESRGSGLGKLGHRQGSPRGRGLASPLGLGREHQRIASLSWLMRTADHREVCGSSLCGATFGDRSVNIQISHTHKQRGQRPG
jgi:hypothetical protein